MKRDQGLVILSAVKLSAWQRFKMGWRLWLTWDEFITGGLAVAIVIVLVKTFHPDENVWLVGISCGVAFISGCVIERSR